MALALDVGVLQTSPGAVVGPLRPQSALGGSVTFSTKAGFSVAVTVTGSGSVTFGAHSHVTFSIPAFTVIASTSAGSSLGDDVTTSAIDTTGANLIVLVITSIPNWTESLTDSEGNAWVQAITGLSRGAAGCGIWYCYNPATSASHTFTVDTTGSGPSIAAVALYGAPEIILDQINIGNSYNPVSPGSVTPTQNGEILITGFHTSGSAPSLAVGSSFTMLQQVVFSLDHNPVAVGTLQQSTAAPEDPSWSWSGGTAGDALATMATFVANRPAGTLILPAIAGFTAAVSNSATNTVLTFSQQAGFFPTVKLSYPVSVSWGAQAGFTPHISYPQTVAFGAHSHFATSETMKGPQSLTFPAGAGFAAFGSTSVPNQVNVIQVVITDPGSGYSPGSGLGATITGSSGTPVAAIVQVNSSGAVTGVTPVTNAGNLTGPLTVAITGGGGSGATATAVLSNPTSGGLGGNSSSSSSIPSAAAGQVGQQQPLQVRAEGYGLLTIETLTLLQGSTPGIQPPPIRQPSAQQVPPGAQQATGDTPDVASRPWNTWFLSVYGQLQPSLSTCQFLCPSVDETDSEWYATGTIDGVTDPITFTATLVGQSRFGMAGTVIQGGAGYSSATVLNVSGAGGSGYGAQLTPIVEGGAIAGITTVTSGYGYIAPLSLVATDTGGGSGSVLVAELGRQFAVGDFILWNDPTIVAGTAGYEIDQITAIVPIGETSATFTIARNATGAPADQAQYGSPFDAHANVAFYRLINKLFVASANPLPGPQVLKFAWDNMTVAAVTAMLPGAPPYTINLASVPYTPGTTTLNPLTNPAAPGLRTMNGAAYTNLGITGALSIGLTASARVSVQAHESIRTVYAKVLVAPTGPGSFNGDANACIVIYVCYISPTGVVGLIDTLVIDATNFNSYSSSNPPDGRQMPFHALWPFNAPNTDWPPNRLPVCTDALTMAGLLQLPIAPDASSTVLFEPDGALDFIVAQVGTGTAGSNLVVTVQT